LGSTIENSDPVSGGIRTSFRCCHTFSSSSVMRAQYVPSIHLLDLAKIIAVGLV
jgi:hypothetical protein